MSLLQLKNSPRRVKRITDWCKYPNCFASHIAQLQKYNVLYVLKQNASGEYAVYTDGVER